MTRPNNRVDRTAATPRRLVAAVKSSRRFRDDVSELSAAVGHLYRYAGPRAL